MPDLGLRRLDDLAQRLFSKPVVGLSTLEASRLIDEVKVITDGERNLDDLLTGVNS